MIEFGDSLVHPVDKPDCPHCAEARQAAEAGKAHGMADSNCLGCTAREIARSLAAWKALRGETDVDLIAKITDAYGTSRIDEGRHAVWGWIKALGLNKRVNRP